MVVPKFFVKQRITVMVNRYEIRVANPDGTEGPLMAFAEQKRMKLKEEIVFFTDESKTRRVFSFKARQRLDVHAEHDVFDEGGHAARLLQQAVRRQPAALDLEPVGARASRPSAASAARSIAILRRIWDFIPYVGDVWVPVRLPLRLRRQGHRADGPGQRAA